MANIGYSESTGQYFDMETGKPVNAAAAETGPWESALIGAGKTFHDVGVNLGIADPIDSGQAMEDLSTVNPISTGVGQALPMMAPIPGALAAQVAGGAGMSYLAREPGTTGIADTILGGAGGGLGHMAGRVADKILGVKAMNTPMTDTAKAYVDTGGTVTPGMAWGGAAGDVAKSLESSIGSKVGGGAAYSGVKNANQKNMNKLAIDALGLDTGKFTKVGDDALNAAYDQIGDQFDDIARSVPSTQLDDALSADLKTYLGLTGRTKATLVKKGADIPDDGPITATGDSLMDMRSRLLKRNKTPSPDSPIYEDLIESIDDVMEANAPAGLAERYGDARGKYRLLKGVEKSISTDGNILPGRMSRQLRDWRSAEGKIGDLRTNVRAGSSQDLGVPYGNSGTAQRSVRAEDWPMAIPYYASGLLERSLLDLGTTATQTGAAVGRGLLSNEAE